MSMGFRHVWETNREGAFALHTRVWVINGENTLTFFLHLRAVYYEGKVEALHVSLSPVFDIQNLCFVLYGEKENFFIS